MVNATQDQYQPVNLVKELYEAIQSPEELLWNDREHIILVDGQQRDILPWLD
jgi:hypothetical protein